MITVTVRSSHPERPGVYEVQSDGARVWVNGPDGASVARISKLGGIDVHRPISEQRATGNECLDCRHDLAGAAAWAHFVGALARHFGVRLTERHRPMWAVERGRAGREARR